MNDGFVQIARDSLGKRIDNTVFERDGVEIHRQRVDSFLGEPMRSDVGGRYRVSQTQTLFDGKILNAENPRKWDTKATGSATFSGNTVNLSVTAGQYAVRQGKFFLPYFSGKPQLIETTYINFANEPGVVKRVGYFSSNAVAPYDSNKDGFWLEADGTTYRLRTSNYGVLTHDIPWEEWDAYDEIADYDWSKFTVNEFDFLWLGGAGGRLFLVRDGVFRLVHTIDDHAGYSDTLIMRSPNQPVRYELRSTGGAGSFRAVCSQVSTEGADEQEQGEELAVKSASITCNAVDTIYALKGVRKSATYRDQQVILDSFGATVVATSATPEAGTLMLLLDPTFSADLSWSANSRVSEGSVNAGQTITNVGRILKAVPMSNSSTASAAPRAALAALTVGIDNTMGTLVLAYEPLTPNQNVAGTMNLIEY
jgi:hypothetical protein